MQSQGNKAKRRRSKKNEKPETMTMNKVRRIVQREKPHLRMQPKLKMEKKKKNQKKKRKKCH